ncbi:hypothetical protein [Kitasatospora sp. DSM 101779]|uniref:hypothetical protein n=1 Tax=Kitasatospora sp. DSM 101779 TaxID=2853165 RepID=UPI0021DAA21A|nr:hypothetical protein [Kitasatospora sp. DSM 101779]MCU7820404.1 hypothetical protein [Kitasatospora sp. DSM 101779]
MITEEGAVELAQAPLERRTESAVAAARLADHHADLAVTGLHLLALGRRPAG